MCWLVNYYRPQTKFAKVMFLHVSVCPQGGVPGQEPPCQVCPRAGTPPLPGTPPWAGTPPHRYTPQEQCMLEDTGNKRAVRILLECILVYCCRFEITICCTKLIVPNKNDLRYNVSRLWRRSSETKKILKLQLNGELYGGNF